MGLKIIVCMETEEPDPVTLTRDKIILGGAELDSHDALPASFMLRQVPDVLRTIADGLESSMTTGPDEATWLQDETPPAPERPRTIGDSIREHGWGGPYVPKWAGVERNEP